MSPTHDNPQSQVRGRRDFLRLVGAAGIASALPGAVSAFAQASPPVAHPAAAADTSAHAKPAEGPSADAVALAEILRHRFPGRLTEEQWNAVTHELDGRLASGRRLRDFKLGNGDEPDSVFRA
jgi:hypothetical protein